MKIFILLIAISIYCFPIYTQESLGSSKKAEILESKAKNYLRLSESNLHLANVYELKAKENPNEPEIVKEAQKYRRKANAYINKAQKSLDTAILLREKAITQINKVLTEDDSYKKDSIRVATWNIQNFGESKMGKIIPYKHKEYSIPEVIADILFEAKFAVVAIQEIEGDNLEPLEHVVEILNSLSGGEVYRLTYPEKMGSSSNTAEFLPMIYNNKLLKLKTQGMIRDVEMQRVPHYAFFSVREEAFQAPQQDKDLFDFCLVSVHLAPKGSRKQDLPRQKDFALLSKVFKFLNKKFVTEDIIISGDFNCDPNRRGIDGELWKSIMDDGGVVHPVMTVENNTAVVATNTMTKGSRVNDNMIWMENTEEDWMGIKKVYDFPQHHFVYNGEVQTEFARQISDHLPIWCEFYTGKDSR